ncbi:MAG: hypothetical protein KGH60_01105 [Candidatus Micrarchaeota archaeon]|nr:hypothetical protein [Candidatus Micrarchaeota archaeon]
MILAGKAAKAIYKYFQSQRIVLWNMSRLEHSDITKAEAFELGLIVGAAPVDKEDAKSAAALQSKLLRKAADPRIIEEVANGILTAKTPNPVDQSSIDKWVKLMKSIGAIKEISGKLVLQYPFIEADAAHLATPFTLKLQALRGTNEAMQLADEYETSLVSGEMRIGEDGNFELTEVFANVLLLQMTLSSYGKNVKDSLKIGKQVFDYGDISKYGVTDRELTDSMNESLMALKWKGLICIEESGLIDIVPEKIKDFVDDIERAAREEGFDLGEKGRLALEMARKLIAGDTQWWVP